MLEVMVDRARSSRSAPISVTTTHLLMSDWRTQNHQNKYKTTLNTQTTGVMSHVCVYDVTFLPRGVQRLAVQERSSSSLSVEQFVLHTAVHDPKLRLTATKNTR